MKRSLFKTLIKGICCALISLSLTSAFAQTSEVWLTTGSASSLLAQQGSLTFGANSGSANTITVNEGSTYQSIDGYGFTLTEGSAKVIAGMSASAQSSLLSELFSTSGVGISIVRIGIGATDLSEWSYTYRDGASFSLSGPDLTYTIPILKKILAINANIKVLATPWSAPMWMKSPQPASFTGGTLDGTHYGDYAQYWLDYMNAMKGQGINIWAITPQNEPLNGSNTPSMTLTKENELGLINSYIGPTLRNNGYNCKIICYDHNCDNTDFPTYVANNSSYVDGSAFHLYAGSISAMTTVKNNTGKNVYFTEQYTGANGSFSGDLSWHTQNITIGSMNNWSRTTLEWNLANDPSYGPHTAGGCTDCKGAVTINGSTVTRNVAYYIISHFSKFVRPDAVRIGATSNHGNLITTAFRNTDGSKVTVVLNNSGGALSFRVVWNNTAINYTLAAGSVVSFKWNGSGGSSAPIGKIITLKGSNGMYASGENGTVAMNCNRATAGAWEQFSVVDAGAGKIGLKSMSKYVSSENGASTGITCNRTSIGGWEAFDWYVNADGTISLRGSNSMYISSNNGTSPMTCDRASISGWEAFIYTVVGTGRAAVEEPVSSIEQQSVTLYPNPAASGVEQNLTLVFTKDAGDIHVQLKDINGANIYSNQFHSVKQRLDISLPSMARGLYLVHVSGNTSAIKKYMIK